MLRLEPSLHAALRAAARDAQLSLNEFCVRKLAAPGTGGMLHEGALSAVLRAAELLGSHLVAVAVIGSWARGESFDGSDVDLLVVVEPALELTRDLYRRWDEHPTRWDDRSVDVHFAHLPAPESATSGIWAECAIEGIVLFERGLALSTQLARIRRDVALGRIARRFAHGQPYWAEVA